MVNRRRYRILYRLIEIKNGIAHFLILSLIIFFVACSPRSGINILKFFFDGVPAKQKKDSIIISSTTGLIVFELINDSIKTNALVAQVASQGLFYHTPYKEKACGKCHNADTPGKTSYAQDGICNTCHTDFQTKYTRIHGPVAGGFCTSCHAPHFSENKNLLVRKGQDLCIYCHEIDQVMKNDTHADIGKDNCTECHNPHGGSSRFILN